MREGIGKSRDVHLGIDDSGCSWSLLGIGNGHSILAAVILFLAHGCDPIATEN